MANFTPSIIFAVIALIAAIFATFSVWPYGRAFGYVVSVIGMAALWQFTSGLPRRVVGHMWPHGTLTGYSLNEPYAIYLWIRPEGSSTPISLQFPWNEKEAADLTKAIKDAVESGVPVQVGPAKEKTVTGTPGDTPSVGSDFETYPTPVPAETPKAIRQ